jgi:hypothetical protein
MPNTSTTPNEEDEWLDIPRTARWTGIPEADLIAAVRGGTIPALVIGANIRISRSALLNHAATAFLPAASTTMALAGTPTGAQGAGAAAPTAGLPRPQGLNWVDEPARLDGGFTYRWPQPAGGDDRVAYDPAWQGNIELNGVQKEVRVGESAGADVPRRRVVLVDGQPVCEFAPCTDGRTWASTIKLGRKTVRTIEALPPIYRVSGVRVEDYRAATGLTGTGVPRCFALVLDAQDLHSAVHHAIARMLGGAGNPVVSA